MRPFIFVLTTLSFSFAAQSWAQSPNASYRSAGVFDGRTPCDGIMKQLQYKTDDDCLKLKWRLTLHGDAAANKGTFQLEGTLFRRQGPQRGTWTLVRGTPADQNALVYQLELTGGEKLLLQKADDNVLLFLDADKKLLVGNGDFSYALNRVEPKQSGAN